MAAGTWWAEGVAVARRALSHQLCGVLGEPRLAEEATYRNNAGRLANRGALVERLSALTAQRKSADLLDALEAVGVPAGPINTPAPLWLCVITLTR